MPPLSAFQSSLYAALLCIAYLGKRRSRPGRPFHLPPSLRVSSTAGICGSARSTARPRAVRESMPMPPASLRLQSVPSGWNMQGQPGRGRGAWLRTAGGVGGKPMAALKGSSHGKKQGKLDGSFMSIQSPSMSTPVSLEKNSANSLFQYLEMLVENQSGNTDTPGHTTPRYSEPLSRFRKMLS